MIKVEARSDADEINVDNMVDEVTGIRYIGTARRGLDFRWRCLAEVGNALCLVELTVHPTDGATPAPHCGQDRRPTCEDGASSVLTVVIDQDGGDEDDAAKKQARIAR